MKKLSKIMLSVAAASVVTAAMAVTAMAADTITGTYNNDTGVVTMEGVIGSGASQTLLVLNNVTEVENSSDIAYINQIDNNGTFSTFTLAAGLKPDTASKSVTFNIKVGGTDGTVQTGTLKIAGDAPATVTIVIGDVNGDNKPNVQDMTAIRRYIANRNKPGTGTEQTGVKKTKSEGGEIILGDVNSDNKPNVQDMTAIRRYIANRNKPGTGTEQTGTQVEVIDDTSAE
jgi:hypothetical protein